MTDHVVRLYAVVLGVLVLFVTWAAVATRPWASSTTDARVRALAARERQLRAESAAVQASVRRRWAVYEAGLARRRSQDAAAARLAAASPPPQVRVVTLPPLTATRAS
jgi:hypothetical protein